VVSDIKRVEKVEEIKDRNKQLLVTPRTKERERERGERKLKVK